MEIIRATAAPFLTGHSDDTNFFDKAGFDSIDAMELTRLVSEQVRVRLEPNLLMQHATIAAFARAV